MGLAQIKALLDSLSSKLLQLFSWVVMEADCSSNRKESGSLGSQKGSKRDWANWYEFLAQILRGISTDLSSNFPNGSCLVSTGEMNYHEWTSLCVLFIRHHLPLIKFSHRRHFKKSSHQSIKSSVYNYMPIESIFVQERIACSSPVPAHNMCSFFMESTTSVHLRSVTKKTSWRSHSYLQVWTITKLHSDTACFFLPWKSSNVVFPMDVHPPQQETTLLSLTLPLLWQLAGGKV